MGEIVMLRLIHVVGGVFWVGAMMYTAFFLLPVVAELGPAGGQMMAALQRRKLFVWLPVVALLTILTGLRLLMIASASFSASYFATGTGQVYLAAAVAAIVAFVIGVAINRPAMMRMTVLAQSLGSTTDDAERGRIQAEIAVLRARGRTATMVVTWLLILAAAGMAVGRYV
jgi:uncharacterized membrane protein